MAPAISKTPGRLGPDRPMHITVLARAKVADVRAVLDAADAVAAEQGADLVLLDPDAVYSARHVDAAVHKAQRAFDRGTASARTLGAEVLLYVAGDRQVKDAITRAGVREGLERVVVVALGPKHGAATWSFLSRVGWSKDPAGLPATNPAALERLGVTPGTGDPEAAVLERVALLDLRK